MAEIVAISSGVDDCNNVGGCSHAYATEKSNITGVTITAGQITGFTMSAPGLWGKLEFDDTDNVAFFNEEGELIGNNVVANGTGLMKFNGVSQAKIEAANKAKACCGVVIIWVHYSGIRRVQGIDVDPDDSSWQISKIPTKIVPNILSDTGDNAERMEYNTPHQGREFSVTTSLNDAAIEAL